MRCYLVGGAVRDRLLDLPVKERDWVVVGSTPEEMERLGFQRVGKDFPVFLHPQTHEEYALARTERKTAPGYKGFEVHASADVTLEQDLARRDLTINAMAEDEQGQLIDPFGGQEDLRDGLLRHVSPAFSEDPVRILRIARFAARFARWGFHVAHGTNALMRKMVRDGEADALVPERVWAETVKALGEDRPERFFEVLRGCGALARVFPEIDALFGAAEAGGPHPQKNSDVPALLVLRQAVRLSADTRVRFAALTQNLGETTPAGDLPHHADPGARSIELIEQLCQRLRVPNEYRDLAVLAARHHLQCHRAGELGAEELVDLLQALDVFRRPDRFEQFLLACEADARGRKSREHDRYPQAEVLRRARSACVAVNSGKLAEQGLKGKELGAAIRAERIAAVARVAAGGQA